MCFCTPRANKNVIIKFREPDIMLHVKWLRLIATVLHCQFQSYMYCSIAINGFRCTDKIAQKKNVLNKNCEKQCYLILWYFYFWKILFKSFFTLSFIAGNVGNFRRHFEYKQERVKPSFLTHFLTLLKLLTSFLANNLF